MSYISCAHTYIHTYIHVHSEFSLKLLNEFKRHRKMRNATGWMILGSNLGRNKCLILPPECPDWVGDAPNLLYFGLGSFS